MAKTRNSKIGTGALLIYALLAVILAAALFELGSGPLGYASLTGLFAPSSAPDQGAAQRYGKLWIKSDQQGHCREYSLDNKTQKIIPSGTVVCNPEQYARYDQRSRTEIIRDAFRGQ